MIPKSENVVSNQIQYHRDQLEAAASSSQAIPTVTSGWSSSYFSIYFYPVFKSLTSILGWRTSVPNLGKSTLNRCPATQTDRRCRLKLRCSAQSSFTVSLGAGGSTRLTCTQTWIPGILDLLLVVSKCKVIRSVTNQ